MIQPYLTAVDTFGETALIFFGGVFSHAIRKGPMLDGPDLGSRRPLQAGGDHRPAAVARRARRGRAGAGLAAGASSRRRSTPGST